MIKARKSLLLCNISFGLTENSFLWIWDGLHRYEYISKPLSIFVQVVRLSSQDVPTAYAYELEAATIVQPEQVVKAVRDMVPQYALA